MARHARRLAAAGIARAGANGGLPWIAALADRRRRLPEFDHFPADDVIDRDSGAQFFLHTHDAATNGSTNGFVHAHCFVRLRGDAFGLRQRTALTHIAAVTFDRDGYPGRMLALNQWVTGEMWQSARATLALMQRFDFSADTHAAHAGRSIASVLQVFWPELRELLGRRDATLRRALDRQPARNVLDDRRMEVICTCRIDLRRRLALLGAI